MASDEYPKAAEYFVVAGLTEKSQPLDEDLSFSSTNLKLGDHRKDPITDICIIDKTLEESCPQEFTCVEETPSGFSADLNHGSLTAHNIFICYRRGKDKPPLVDLGVYYESLENVRSGISIIETTPAGRSANVNNKSGMGSHPIYLTFRRAKESAPQNTLVVTDICIILSNKGERAPYAFCQIEKNLNKGLIGSSVYLCYKKSMRQVDSISYKAGVIDRYPREDMGTFSLPDTVPLFCLPMGATIECWSSQTKHPFPTFSSFVLTNEKSEKIFGAVVSFYENYAEEKLNDDQKFKLGLLRGDGMRVRTTKSTHTNKAICLLSRWPMFSAFRDFLFYLYKMTVSPNAHAVPVERHIAHFIHKVPFPSSQRPRVQYQMSPFHLTILTRPQITPIPLSGASFLALLDDMGPENTITLLVLALTEHKIVIHSLRPAEITRVAEALITLIFPFKWQCTYVPLCPLEMAYVMEAPCPFIVGVDSRYFDLYEPPSDVACVNLDTNSITLMDRKRQVSWKLLPRKPAKLLLTTLQKYFKELKEWPREEGLGLAHAVDPDMQRTERHRKLELNIQESILKLMIVLMKGYRQYLLPITEAPSEGTTDPSSLFNIQEFVRSRDKSAHRFFNMLIGTQLFSSFIEERSLTSVIGGGEVAAGRSSSLVFFDECIDRLTPDYEHTRLIEDDMTSKSEHTVMIIAPDETGLPPGEGYQYTLFPRLQDELFALEEPPDYREERHRQPRPRRVSDTFAFGRRTKQEVRAMQKMAKRHYADARLWSRLLLSHTYGAWFACLPAFVLECRHKSAALRTAHDALYALEEKECLPLPDETYYRMLLHLCATYNKPALAVRVYQFVRKTNTQLSAITYGLYNKAVLEGTWPSSNRDGYMLWRKLRNVLLVIRQFRFNLRIIHASMLSEDGSDFDDESQGSMESSNLPYHQVKNESKSRESYPPVSSLDDVNKPGPDDDLQNPGVHDPGYSSMPKDQVRRGSPIKNPSSGSPKNMTQKDGKVSTRVRSNSGSTETTDSVISSVEGNDTPKSAKLERTSSNRSVQPPSTLDIPQRPNGANHSGEFPEMGMRSDDTLVNGDSGTTASTGGNPAHNLDDSLPFSGVSPPVSPSQSRGRGPWSIVRSWDDCFDGALIEDPLEGELPTAALFADNLRDGGLDTNNAAKSIPLKIIDSTQIAKERNLIGCEASHVAAGLSNHDTVLPPKFEVTDCDVTKTVKQSASACSRVAQDLDLSQLPTPSAVEDNVFPEKKVPAAQEQQQSFPVEETKQETENIRETGTRSSSEPPAPRCSDSPATPEIASLFKDDYKFFSSMSDSDQRRYQELCSRRASSIDSDTQDSYRSTRHNSLLSAHKLRSSSALYASGGGISPLVGQKSFISNPNTPTARKNFDNITAEDLVSHRPLSAGRSTSGSILSGSNKSPSRFDSPSRRKLRKMAGNNNLTVRDGVPMLTSTPLRPLIEPNPDEDKTDKDQAQTPSSKKRNSTPGRLGQLKLKQEAVRQDISHLAEDPLSPKANIRSHGSDPLSLHVAEAGDPLTTNSSSNSLSRHLVAEIEGHLEKDSLIRSSSDATSLRDHRQRLNKSNEKIEQESGEKKLQRKASLPSQSPNNPRRKKPPPLQRSLTCHEDIANESSNSWFGSGSKFNSLLKATTVGMASKAKKAATNFAKDINETMQASLALYTLEKGKGSFSDISLRSSQEDMLSKGLDVTDGRRRYGDHVVDHHSSQSSLRSSDSFHSAQEARFAASSDKVPRRSSRRKKRHHLDRPLSVPHFDSTKGRVPSLIGNSALSIPGAVNDSASEANVTSSTNSLNTKVIADIEVIISSCSRCHKCNCLIYDEEIMAGWFGDDSNLNTHCPFCNSLFVPFLNIEITDFRFASSISSFDATQEVPPVSEAPGAAFEGSFTVVGSPDASQASETPSLASTSTHDVLPTSDKPDESRSGPAAQNDTSVSKDASRNNLPSSTDISFAPSTGSSIRAGSEESTVPRNLEAITVPYLSSLVLRKELESLLENEGSGVLAESHFVDHHPIIYWNLVWCFRRLNLHSNLYNLLPLSDLLHTGSNRLSRDQSNQSSKCHVMIYLMWDNLKLQEISEKPPLYCAWIHMNSAAEVDEDFAYSASFLHNILESIKTDDVRGPLVAVLNELNVQQGGVRRSAYREILYLVLVALGKSMIDVDAFDREYKRAYDALTTSELALARKCDRPPSSHVADARNMFGVLDLVK